MSSTILLFINILALVTLILSLIWSGITLIAWYSYNYRTYEKKYNQALGIRITYPWHTRAIPALVTGSWLIAAYFTGNLL